MKVEFRDSQLAVAVRTASAVGTRYSQDLIRAANKKLTILESVSDERDLRNWKSLHYEKLLGDREGQRSVRVNDKYRLVFVLQDGESPPVIEILELIDYH